MEKFTIVRDTREKPTHGWTYEPNAYCAGTVSAALKTGDYSVQGMEQIVCVERKLSVTEFANNCVVPRWIRCMERMSRFKHAYLLFEFSQDDINNYPQSAKVPNRIKRRLRGNGAFLRKMIYRARDEYNIHVIPCNNTVTAEKVAYTILKKAYELQCRVR